MKKTTFFNTERKLFSLKILKIKKGVDQGNS